MQQTVQLDPAVLATFPDGDRVIAVERKQQGTSSSESTTTARVKVVDGDGIEQSYFLKFLQGPDAYERVHGEYMSMEEIHQTLPTIAPRPRGYGKCKNDERCFFLCDFISPGERGEREEETSSVEENAMPNPMHLAKKLTNLHLKSHSPTTMFGFHSDCTVYDGRLPLNTDWDPSWTFFFTKLMRGVYYLDVHVNGHWQKLDDVMQITFNKLIPRLLDPLAAENRTIKPTLIHGDLWESNIITDANGDIFIFDACAYYAHHEKELGIWAVDHHKMKDPEYTAAYWKQMHRAPDEPREESDDRILLYSVETLLIHSAHFPMSPEKTREKALERLKSLNEKYIS